MNTLVQNQLMTVMKMDSVEEAKELIGLVDLYPYNGRMVECVEVEEFFAVVKDVETGAKWKVLWADMFKPLENV